MTRPYQVTASGDGTRPTTDEGVANIGGGASLTGKKNALGESVEGPAPSERMSEKREDADAARNDDSAAFGLKENSTPATNQDHQSLPKQRKNEHDQL